MLAGPQMYRPKALNPIITADTIPKASPAKESHGVVPSHESSRYPAAPAMTTLSAQAVPTQKKSPNDGMGAGFSDNSPGSSRGGPGFGASSSLTRVGALVEAH
jgi:hypothetical protein